MWKKKKKKRIRKKKAVQRGECGLLHFHVPPEEGRHVEVLTVHDGRLALFKTATGDGFELHLLLLGLRLGFAAGLGGCSSGGDDGRRRGGCWGAGCVMCWALRLVR